MRFANITHHYRLPTRSTSPTGKPFILCTQRQEQHKIIFRQIQWSISLILKFIIFVFVSLNIVDVQFFSRNKAKIIIEFIRTFIPKTRSIMKHLFQVLLEILFSTITFQVCFINPYLGTIFYCIFHNRRLSMSCPNQAATCNQ